MINYQYEILKVLVSNDGQADVDILFNQLTKDIQGHELGKERNRIACTILNMTAPETHYVRTINFSANTGLGKYFDTRRSVQDGQDEPDIDKEIMITNEGRFRFAQLKELYEPPMSQPTYSATFGGDFKGNFNQGNSDDLNQTLNEESKESKELTKEQLKDALINRQFLSSHIPG